MSDVSRVGETRAEPAGSHAPAGETPRLFDNDDVHRYWDARHAAEGDLRAGGDVGLSEEDNEVFYRIRLGLLLQALACRAPLPVHSTVLDAGCGKGWFSAELASLGMAVHGVDASPTAIAVASESYAGSDTSRPTFERVTLADFRARRFFDAVVSVDVMFHIVVDSEWEATVTNLADAVRPGGTLVLADTTADVRSQHGVYIVHRPPSEYLGLLAGRGYRLRDSWPYRFRSNPLGFHVYERMW